MPGILKEYFESAINMRGPFMPNAAPMVTGATCLLRFEDRAEFDTIRGLTALFEQAALDFPDITIDRLAINRREKRLEIEASPPPLYTRTEMRFTGAVG